MGLKETEFHCEFLDDCVDSMKACTRNCLHLKEYFVPYIHVWSNTMIRHDLCWRLESLDQNEKHPMWNACTSTEIKTFTGKIHVSRIAFGPLKSRSLDTLGLNLRIPGNECDMRSSTWSLEFGRDWLRVGYQLITEVRSCLWRTISLNSQTACIGVSVVKQTACVLVVYGESLLRLYALRATLRLPECDFRRTSCPLKIEICWDFNSVPAGKR
jgi:hypothetical protein